MTQYNQPVRRPPFSEIMAGESSAPYLAALFRKVRWALIAFPAALAVSALLGTGIPILFAIVAAVLWAKKGGASRLADAAWAEMNATAARAPRVRPPAGSDAIAMQKKYASSYGADSHYGGVELPPPKKAEELPPLDADFWIDTTRNKPLNAPDVEKHSQEHHEERRVRSYGTRLDGEGRRGYARTYDKSRYRS